jgi:hypothetical protein
MFLTEITPNKGRCLMKNIIHESETIYKRFKELKIAEIFTHVVVKHLLSIVIASFSLGYKGKTVDFARYSSHHRTTVAHFLNQGKWHDSRLEDLIKTTVREKIYAESVSSGKPIYCMVDDTISSKTKPSSQALHPIENAYFHQSHLKKKQDYGHQIVSVMLSCNGITLNYANIMYDKSKTKIEIVQDIAAELPEAPVASYFLCDSWYTSKKIMEAFFAKGYYTIGALRTNRVIYPCNIKKKINEFALFMEKTDSNVRLVTVGSRQYYIYRYEGKLNGVDDAVVLISYPKDAFGKSKALRAFISTDTSLSTDEILEIYTERWPIEVFFRQCKNVLAFDKYQIRSATGIKRFWLIMSLAHLLCCTASGFFIDFAAGYSFFQRQLHIERVSFIYQCGADGIPLNDVLHLTA